MTPGTASESPLRASARLMLDLHRLTTAGLGDDVEADAVRESMEHPWYEMSPLEQQRIRGLSADLYGIAEGLKAVPMSAADRADWERLARRAFEGGDADGLLDLLRHPPADIPPQEVYAQQGWCWDQLGHFEVAFEFMDAAARRDPRYAIAAVALLRRMGRSEDDELAYVERLLDHHGERLVRELKQIAPGYADVVEAVRLQRAGRSAPVDDYASALHRMNVESLFHVPP